MLGSTADASPFLLGELLAQEGLEVLVGRARHGGFVQVHRGGTRDGGGDGDGRRRRGRVAERRELGGGRGGDRREVHVVDIAHGRARVGVHPLPGDRYAHPGVVRSAVRAGAVRAGHLVLLLAGGRRRDVSVVLRRREVAFGRQPARGGGVTGSTGQRGVARAARRGFWVVGSILKFVAERRGGAGGETSRSGRSRGERRPCAMRMGWSHLTDIVDMVVSAVAGVCRAHGAVADSKSLTWSQSGP